jgi:pilus assembly protein Flp/PilA
VGAQELKQRQETWIIQRRIDMVKHVRVLMKNDEGASAVEYGLIVALIAGVIILAIQGLGNTLNTTFTNVNSVISSVAGS